MVLKGENLKAIDNAFPLPIKSTVCFLLVRPFIQGLPVDTVLPSNLIVCSWPKSPFASTSFIRVLNSTSVPEVLLVVKDKR